MGKTLFEKIWEKHVVKTIDDGPSVLYIDKHFIHEVTSPAGLYWFEQKRHQSFSSETNSSHSRSQCTYAESAFTYQRRIVKTAGRSVEEKLRRTWY